MKASVMLALTGSLLVVANPIKRAIVTDVVTDVVVVTVTVEAETSTVVAHYAEHTDRPTFKPTTSSTSTTSSSSTSTSTTPTPTTTSTSSTPVVETTTSATSSSAVVNAAAVASSSSTSSAASSTATDFDSTVLYHHNLHRSNHSASGLEYNSTLASYAATVGASCVFAHDLTPGGGGYGQNIAMYGSTGDIESSGSSVAIAQAITDMWYNGEVGQFLDSYYGEATPDTSNFEGWGHFSQLVWASTTSVGCAAQYCEPDTIASGMGAWFTVCNYYTAGNVGGEYGDNVLPSIGDATVTAPSV